jgi:hypothetical protein
MGFAFDWPTPSRIIGGCGITLESVRRETFQGGSTAFGG